MFFEDAITVSKTCDLVLTSKACGDEEKAPMCGVPYHAVESYIAQLIGKGFKVAIGEQLVDPSTVKKGIVPRDVIRVVTPGTVISTEIVSEKENNYLCAIYIDDSEDIAWCDLSTGEFRATHYPDDENYIKLLETLDKIQPHEIIINCEQNQAPEIYEYAQHANVLISFVGKNLVYEETAPSMLLAYLRDTQKQEITHLEPLRYVNDNVSMRLDRSTLRNLEITETIFDKGTNGSLVSVLDKCQTSMGSRRLKQWLKEPLTWKVQIEGRLQAVETLTNNEMARNNIRSFLKHVYDLERLCARISLGTANARDFLAIKQSLFVLNNIKAELKNLNDAYIRRIDNQINPLEDLYQRIDAAIMDNPPLTIREGGLIKPGFSEELDDINASIQDSKIWLDNLEDTERERTGLKLKVGYNKVFGYYIEVTKTQLQQGQAPEDYIRKQTLVNAERFITPKLKEIENILINAQSRINDLEYQLFNELKQYIQEQIPIIQRTALCVSVLDVICSFAEVAVRNGYVKPSITDNSTISIVNGRHPVIEKHMKSGAFVSNDVHLDNLSSSFLLITGPNMAGKSTYMRQLALIVLMAQIGCFVPADSATIGICDRIYTRIGASDNISMGQSTFYVEMSELAYILKTATPKSLIILDEIGRGTSTLDGLAIAWAVVDKLTQCDKKIRTLFATHYHELTKLSNEGLRNLNVEVLEENDEIAFKHKIVEGSASKSYGVQVAKLAGIPEDVLANARKYLDILETGSSIANDISDRDMGVISVLRTVGNVGNDFNAGVLSNAKDSDDLIVPTTVIATSGSDAVIPESNNSDITRIVVDKIKQADLMNMRCSDAIALIEELKDLVS